MSAMDSVLANTFSLSDDIIGPSPSFMPPQQGPQNEVQILFDDLFSNDDFIKFWDSGAEPRPFSPPHVSPQGGTLPPDTVRPFPQHQTTRFDALPHSALNSFGVTYAPLSHPLAPNLAGSSSAVLDVGEQTSFFGTQNISMPMASEPALGLAPGSSSSSSLNSVNPVSVNPTFGWRTGALNPLVRVWDATAPSMARANTASAFVRAEPRQVPDPRCTCYRRQPLVRVDDTIEWVRPDVMKMALYFNFSWDAEAEAHSSWEPHNA